MLTEERVRQMICEVVEQEWGRPGMGIAAAWRVWEAIEALTAAQQQTEKAVGALAEAQRRTEERLEELAAAQRRTDRESAESIAGGEGRRSGAGFASESRSLRVADPLNSQHHW